MTRGPAQFPRRLTAQAGVDFFERSKESGEGFLQMQRPLPCLREIAMTELAEARDHRRAHRPVLVRTLCPNDFGITIDPQCEPHYVENRRMPSEKELLERIRQLEEQNSNLQDKLDMIYAILAPDFEDASEEDEDARPGFVQIERFGTQKKLD